LHTASLFKSGTTRKAITNFTTMRITEHEKA
jgi:hypothetical protein